MRILKTGTLPGYNIKRGTCVNCHCVVELLQEECDKIIDGRGEVEFSTVCPTEGCYYKIFVFNKKEQLLEG